MAESKFLKFQDIDRDGVIDVCDDDLTTPELPCKGPCTPDPTSLIPDWKKHDIYAPFLNTKICHFQITKVTYYDSTGDLEDISSGDNDENATLASMMPPALNSRFEQFKEEAVRNLLDFCPIGARLNNEETRGIISAAIQFKKFDLDARPNSRLKLLYSVPFDILYDLADPPVATELEEEEGGPGWENVTYKADTIMTDAIRVRKGLFFYSKLLKVSSAIGEGDAYHINETTGQSTHRFNLEDVGDPALFSRGQLSDMIDKLKGFLHSTGRALPDGGIMGDPFSIIFKEKVTKIKFGFKDKRLRVLRVWTEECGDKPAVYNLRSGSLRALVGDGTNKRFDWNNETLVNYFINLSKMARHLNSRVEQPWREFLEQYTYPAIKVTKFPVDETIDSCLYGAIRDEVSELGNDILDQVFGLGDLVSYLYNDTLCREKLESILEDDQKMNRLPNKDPQSPFGKEVAAILAKNQRWAKLSADDDVILRLCVNAFDGVANSASGMANKISGGLIPTTKVGGPGGPMGNFQGLWEEAFQSLKLCGLLDLMFDALGCLLGGLSLQDALPIIIKKALEAMGIEQFGELFVGLSPEQQEKMDAVVKKNLAKIGKSTENIRRPWTDSSVIAAERVRTNPANLNNYESVIPPSYGETMNELAGADRTVLSQLDSVGAGNEAGIDGVMDAYIEALLEVYQDNLILILDELNNFPGAPLIRDIISLTALKCPRPPLFHPGIDDFIKSLGLAFCRTPREVVIPSLNQALELRIAFKDMLKPLFIIARFLVGMIIMIIVNQIIAKVCEILVRAVCKALETTGDLVIGLPGALSGAGPSLREILKENICGEDADDEMIDASIVDMMSIMGLGPAAFADRDKTIAFANDLSLGVTRQEFADALTGKPSEEFLESVDQLIEFVHPEFRDAMPNRSSIARFAKSIGNFLPLEYREILNEYSKNSLGFDDGTPANPSICSSPEQIATFQNLRAELLSGRASPKQIEQLYCDLQDDNLDDLESITEILNVGIGPYIADKIPNILSTPGCDDGLLPFEPPEMLEASIGFMGSALDALENDFLDDMMGTGFTAFGSGDSNFGFLNLILCDTHGNPLTNHHRKASNRKGYVDFASNLPNGGETSRGLLSFLQGNADFTEQEGQLTYFVGEWMKRQFLNGGKVWEPFDVLKPGFNRIDAGGLDLQNSINFKSTNQPVMRTSYHVSTEEMGYDNLFGKMGMSTFTLPDFGYNTKIGKIDKGSPDILVDDDTIEIIRLPRKGDPAYPGGKGKPQTSYDKSGADINLDFRDNSMGTRQGLGFGTHGDGGNTWSYGFEVQCFYSDIEEIKGEYARTVRNRPDDNIRVSIVEKVNYGADRRFASPLAKAIVAEDMRLPPFDLPNWIENIPIVGWALEKLITLIMLPFSALISGILSLLAYLFYDDIKRYRKFEFLALDDGLDAFEIDKDVDENKEKALDLNDFPQYLSSRAGIKSYPPQVAALGDLLGTKVTGDLKTKYDNIMERFYKDFSLMIGENEYGWKTGAVHDLVTPTMFEYGVEQDGQFIPYDVVVPSDFLGDALGAVASSAASMLLPGPDDENMILGITYDQYVNGDDARVVVLDPMVYGGTYNNPPLHCKPLKYNGWWGMTQAMFPSDTACKPHGKNLIDFDEVKKMIQDHYPSLEDDTRLYSDIECARQVPFDRILPRHAKMQLYTLIVAAIRIYASTHLMKAIGTFSTVQPKFPDNYSTIYSAYLAERMEEDFKNAQGAFWEAFNPFKDEEFWYSFLEQSVTCYDFLVSVGEIEEPVKGGYIQRAADTINDLQTHYAFTYRTKDERTYTDEKGDKKKQTVPGLWEAKWTGDAGFFESLQGFRERKNLEGVQSVEDAAKIFLQELINYELTNMGEKFVQAMEQAGFKAKIFDLDYWLFENKCIDSEIKYRGPEIVEKAVNIPSKADPDPLGEGSVFPGPYFTAGNQFRVAIDSNEEDTYGYSEEYIGYYHIHLDDAGDEVYMAGPVHDPATSHDTIVPVGDAIQITTIETTIIVPDSPTTTVGPDGEDLRGPMGTAPKIINTSVPIGNVPDFGTGGTYTDDMPFKLEKYTSINGAKYVDAIAKDMIMANQKDKFLSDIYPGSLRMITNQDGAEVGIEGNMGVRHGLAFYYEGEIITTVEVDALDYMIGQFQTVQPNSKLLHCLLQNLKHDPKYKMLTSYIFSMKKVLSTLAIYNDYGFLASIGEVTPGTGDNHRGMMITKKDSLSGFLSMFGLKIASQENPDDWAGTGVNGGVTDTASDFVAVQSKPGARAYINQVTVERKITLTDKIKEAYGLPFWYDDDIEFEDVQQLPNGSFVTGNEGWAHAKDRPWFTPFTLNWDEWDRELLRNSRSRIKSMFKAAYDAAHDRPGKKHGPSPAKIKLRNLKARLFPSPGAGMLPWWQRSRMKSNPYNADGQMCDGPDMLG